MQVGEVRQVRCPYAVPDSNDGVRHIVLECVDEVQEVAAVVVPACCPNQLYLSAMIDPCFDSSEL